MALRLMNRPPKKRSLSSITIFFHNATRFAVSVNEDQGEASYILMAT